MMSRIVVNIFMHFNELRTYVFYICLLCSHQDIHADKFQSYENTFHSLCNVHKVIHKSIHIFHFHILNNLSEGIKVDSYK